MTVLWLILLILLLLTGWVLTLLGAPGNWLIVAATAGYVLLVPVDSAVAIGWPTVIALIGLAGLGELLEFMASALGVAKAGGSKRGAVLAIVGSIVGAIAGVFVGVPIPVVGPLVAALVFGGLGAMAGAMLGETWKGRRFDETWQAGKAAFWGRLLGTLAKVIVGSIMVVVTLAIVVL